MTVPITVSGNTITMTISDNGPYDANSTAGTISDPGGLLIPSQLGEKEGVIASLGTLSAATNEDRHDLGEAIRQVSDSTDPSLWNADGLHLERGGGKVFDHEKQAVQQLAGIIRHGRENATFNGIVENNMGTLVGVDKAIATTAISDAASAASGLSGAHARDAQNDLAQAQKEMAKASDETSKGQYDAAIDHYKNAWGKAQDAIHDAAQTGHDGGQGPRLGIDSNG